MNYTQLATPESVNKTAEALKANGVEAIVVENGAEALAKIKVLIPAGTTLMSGASVTLEQIGFIEYLKAGQHGWNNLKDGILAEKDPAKQALLREQAVLANYYLGSVHALVETGEFVIASNTGSQLPHIVFTSPNLIFIVSTKKIVPTLADAMTRLEQHVVPLEDARMMAQMKVHTSLNKIVTFKKENPMMKRKVRMILVGEDLGF
jgi:L-lactate utilization protein LutB